MAKSKGGRPALKPAERLAEIVQFRLTAEERAQCEQAAELEGVKFSTWIRDRLLRAAKREIKGA